MHTIEVTTKAGSKLNGLEVEYPVTVQQFDSCTEALVAISELEPNGEAADALADALAPYEDKLKAVTGVINSAQKQGATQGPKQLVRDVLDKLTPVRDDEGNLIGCSWTDEDGAEDSVACDGKLAAEDVEFLASEVADAQRRGEKYVIGAPRGITTGTTKTKMRQAADEVQELGLEAQKEFERAIAELKARYGA